MKFLRIEISYDCVVIEGYRTRTKKSYEKLSFHESAIGSWSRICLFESKDRIVLCTAAVNTQNDTDLLVPDCKFVMVKFQEENNTLLSYDCKTGFATKILDPSSVA